MERERHGGDEQRIEKWKTEIKRVTFGLIVKEREGKQERRKESDRGEKELKTEVCL